MAVTRNISLLLKTELVVMATVGSNVVKASEGVNVTSVVKELRTVKLENIDIVNIGIVEDMVVTLSIDTLGVVNMTGVLRKLVSTGDKDELDSMGISTEVLAASVTTILDVAAMVNGVVTPNVVWLDENKDEVITTETMVVGSTVTTGEDNKMVTTGTIVVVKIASEENVAITVVVTGCSVVGRMAIVLVLVVMPVTSVVRTT